MALVQQLIDMGFPEADARKALQQAGDLETAVEKLLSGAIVVDPPGRPLTTGRGRVEELADGHPMSPMGNRRPALTTDSGLSKGVVEPAAPQLPPPLLSSRAEPEDPDLSAALEISMREQHEGLGGGAEGVAREEGTPCGLRNVGNTCYVNSFLQTLLHVDDFRERMLRYRTPVEAGVAVPQPSAKATEPDPEVVHIDKDDASLGRREHCIRLASELRLICAYSLFTLRSCIDPSRLLNELVDERGQKLQIGSQEDVGEFMLKLLDRLEEGVRAGCFENEPEAEGADAMAGGDAEAQPATDDAARLDPAAPDDGGASGDAEAQAAPDALAMEASGTGADPAAGGDGHAVAEEAAQAFEDTEVTEPEPQPGDEVAAGAVAASAVEPAGHSPPEAGRQVENEPKVEAPPSPLQSLFFGQQVQVFSYREGPAAADGSEAPGAGAGGGDPVVTGSEEDAGPSMTQAQEAADEKGGRLVVSEEKSDFLQIFLDVKHRDLYSAWEAANCTEVDYTTPGGTTTTASTSIWIERLPKLLFFQLQRVVFDQERKAQVKLDEAFEFDTTVFVDRFLLANREHASQVAVRARDLKRRRDELAEALRRFEEYRGRQGVGVEEVLDWAAECLEENARCSAAVSEAAAEGAAAPPMALECCDPDRLTASGLQESCIEGTAPCGEELRAGAPSAARLLRSVREACQMQANVLRQEVERLNTEIGYAHKELRRHPYELHAIWVHQGIAGSGHYWAYLRDWHSDRWIRFDDAIVSFVSWEDVHAAATGQAGSNTGAYVLVYMAKELGDVQSRSRDQATALAAIEPVVPRKLLDEIRHDNLLLKEEQQRRLERIAEEELRQHSQAIFQHYAGLIHAWEPDKRQHDTVGSAHEPTQRKFLHDAALLKFELFLYRLHGEQDVWTYFLEQSINAQRELRQWTPEDEGRIMHFLEGALRSQKACASMLKERTSSTGRRECELRLLPVPRLMAQYHVVLLQAHIVDEALTMLQAQRSKLLDAVAMMALVWAKWNLEADDKFRQNEILLIMSSLIYQTVQVLEKQRRSTSEAPPTVFQPACEYFLLLLSAVEWPKGWKQPLVSRIQALYPQAQPSGKQGGVGSGSQKDGVVPQGLKEAILNHPLTQAQAHWESFDESRPEPGQDFFERHRTLYQWAMQNDEAIAQEYVINQVPSVAVDIKPGEVQSM